MIISKLWSQDMFSIKLTLEWSHLEPGHDVSTLHVMTCGDKLCSPLFLGSQDFCPPKGWRLHLGAGGWVWRMEAESWAWCLGAGGWVWGVLLFDLPAVEDAVAQLRTCDLNVTEWPCALGRINLEGSCSRWPLANFVPTTLGQGKEKARLLLINSRQDSVSYSLVPYASCLIPMS